MILCRRIVCERDSARAGADTFAGSSRLTACAPLARATQRRFGFQERRLAQAGGRWLFIAGQIGWDKNQKIVSDDLIEQFDRALANVITIVTEAGGKSDQIARLIIYVIDKDQYRTRMKEIGERYRARMGKHFPAMVLVQVAGLLEDHAKIEIEGIAVL